MTAVNYKIWKQQVCELNNKLFWERRKYDKLYASIQSQLNKAIDLTLKMHDNCIDEGHVMATKAKILQELTRLK